MKLLFIFIIAFDSGLKLARTEAEGIIRKKYPMDLPHKFILTFITFKYEEVCYNDYGKMVYPWKLESVS